MDVYQQIAQRLHGAQRILIAFPHASNHKETGDGLCSALALFRYLKNIGKEVTLAASDFIPASQFGFLPHIEEVRPKLENKRQYTLRIDTGSSPLQQWSYGLKDGALEIYLTPENGFLSSESLQLKENAYPYDVLVTLDAPDLSSLGKLFGEHPELFYRTPIINIDHHPQNEQYGQINLVDINAAATGEIITNLLKAQGAQRLDEHIATHLFAAIFLKTGGFKNASVTPATLKLAAQLIQLGARREEIMKNVFRSRSLASLRLWGRALAHLKYDPQLCLAWSTLTMREILESGGNLDELPDVIEELIFTSPEARLVALLYEEGEGRICVLLGTKRATSTASHNLPWTVIENAPGRTRYCLADTDLISAEREVVAKLKGMLSLIPHG